MEALLLIDKEEEGIAIQTIDRPVPSSGQALVKVRAAALNHRDQWCREGKYAGIKFGTVLGSDGAGIVEKVGDEKDKGWIGKEVLINPNINWGNNPEAQAKGYQILGMPVNGTLAEYIVVNVDRLHDKPAHLNFFAAAALPLGGLTAYRAVFRRGQVKAGDKVLISGIGGGVAQFAFQFALAQGAEVYVTSGNADKIAKARSMGAIRGYVYSEKDWHNDALGDTGGFDVVIDSAGGDQINTLLKVLKPAGRLVLYGATTGLPSSLDLRRLFWNQITVQGSTMGNDEEFKEMLTFVEKHKIEPIIDSVRPFAEVIAAFNAMRDGEQTGKLVLEI